MSFFDKVTRAVGDAVDKGKKDLDQFMRIQKVNGEIGAIESKVAELRNQVQQATQEAGAKAIALVKAGSISSSELEVFVERLTTIDQQIAVEQAAIAEKKADIERIKAEHAAEHTAAAPAMAAPVVPPPVPVAPPPLPSSPSRQSVAPTPAVPPLPQSATTCQQCGKPLTGGAFCTECGAKVG